MRTLSIRGAAGLMALALLIAPLTGAEKSPKAAKCTGDFGTSVQFEKSPSAAAKKALAEEKLVVVLHVSGDFEDSGLT
jgi:hypothetical protein